MKITAMEQTESVRDVLCDVCGDSTRVEGYGLQFGTLRASWGYGSSHDGERYEVHLCEPCFFRVLSGLRRERMVSFMFGDEDQELVSERASHLAGGYPVMRQQLGQGAGLLRRQAHEHVLQVGVRIVPVQAG